MLTHCRATLTFQHNVNNMLTQSVNPLTSDMIRIHRKQGGNQVNKMIAVADGEGYVPGAKVPPRSLS